MAEVEDDWFSIDQEIIYFSKINVDIFLQVTSEFVSVLSLSKRFQVLQRTIIYLGFSRYRFHHHE